MFFKRFFQRAGTATDEQIAHVFRRCGFGPRPGQVEQWRDQGASALLESLLSDDDEWSLAAGEELDQFGDLEDLDDGEVMLTLLDQMMAAPNPLHERMTWYWHTHFTTSSESSNIEAAYVQHHLLRRHALGNFATLARQITTDAAMLQYLDGAGSYGENPNENYAREFLELFTLGREGGYTEDDVRAAARILSGWHVEWETRQVRFEPDTHYDRPVSFMGERRRWTIDSFVDFVCDLPACHRHVAARLYEHLVGPNPAPERIDELAATFAAGGLEIRPLVAEILRGDDFMAAIHSRARQPLEWLLAATQAMGYSSFSDIDLKPWQIDGLGQVPYRPPNVAGWPLHDRWSSTSQIITRTSLMLDWQLPESTVNRVAPTVEDVLARCGIFDPSPSTRAALDAIEDDFSEFDYRLELLFTVALTSPEFSLL